MEAVCLGIFMISASFFATILEYKNSPVRQALPNDFVRLCLMGFSMGFTALLINYSPMGKLSGAHMNPALTFTFYGLGKIKRNDAIFYSLFQCIGGIAAVTLMSFLIGCPFHDIHVNYVVTAPGKFGVQGAFVVEVIIAFCMMTMVLTTSNRPGLKNYTGAIAGFFVMIFVILSGPISGFSMNPARTIASAVPSGTYRSFWVYMTAPFIGFGMAAFAYKNIQGKVICAKIHHSNHYQCIFNCGYCSREIANDKTKGAKTIQREY
jgi:aquaporin Z